MVCLGQCSDTLINLKSTGFGSWRKVPGQTCYPLPLTENQRSQSTHVVYKERKTKLPKSYY